MSSAPSKRARRGDEEPESSKPSKKSRPASNWVVEDVDDGEKNDDKTKVAQPAKDDVKGKGKPTKKDQKPAKTKEDEQSNDDASISESSSSESDSDSGSDDDDDSIVNVDFDFADISEIDFHGLKNLLRQLIPVHEDSDLDASDLVDSLINREVKLGSTVKVADDEGGDPYAVVTVFSLSDKEKPGIKTLRGYLERRGGQEVKTLLADKSKKVAFLWSERLINMPPQLAPKLFELLLEELEEAVKEHGKGWEFDHFVHVAKTYREVESNVVERDDEDENEAAPTKKGKKSGKPVAKPSTTTFYFHPEDELLVAQAVTQKDYNLPKDPTTSDGRRVFSEFGIEPKRKILVLDRAGFLKGCKAIVQMAGEGQ